MLNARKSGEGRVTARRAYAAALRLCRQAGSLSLAVAHPDATLLALCAEYGLVRQRIDRLSAKSTRIADEDERSRTYTELTNAGRMKLVASLSARATTLDGHRAHAALFLAWDEGELVGRARRDMVLEEQLLAALLLDLVAG